MLYNEDQYSQFEILDISKHEKLSLVIFDGPEILKDFEPGGCYLYVGEVNNMKAHVAIAFPDGKIKWGYHEDNFRVIPEDDSFVW
jgi:hypothetical protein